MLSRDADIRQAPTPAFIDALRSRYRLEPEIDRVLTRKLSQRAAGPFVPPDFARMQRGLDGLLSSKLNAPYRTRALRWMSGGASKLMMSFDLEWQGLDGKQPVQTLPLVIRMSPAESTVETSRRRESEILNAMSDLIPVPRCWWLDEEAEYFPYPALVYARAEGVVKPAGDASQQVTGLGINFGPALRERVTAEFMRDLAVFHTAPVDRLALPSFERPSVGSNEGALRQVAHWRRVWDEDRGEAEPLMEITANWLEAHAPALDHVSVVHGDCRSGNFLIDPGDGRITAWLDWELAVLGDRHQDLTWATCLPYSHLAEDGRTLLVNGMLPLDEFYAAYERASGLPIDPQRVRWWRVYNAWVQVVVCVGTAYRIARGGKTHQDVVLSWLNGISGMLLEQLRYTLAEVLA